GRRYPDSGKLEIHRGGRSTSARSLSIFSDRNARAHAWTVRIALRAQAADGQLQGAQLGWGACRTHAATRQRNDRRALRRILASGASIEGPVVVCAGPRSGSVHYEGGLSTGATDQHRRRDAIRGNREAWPVTADEWTDKKSRRRRAS